MEKERVEEDRKFISWLSEIHKKDIALVGGKGANLGEMFNSGFPVPQAFVVTINAFEYFLRATGTGEQIEEILKKINVDDTKKLDKYALQIKELIIEAKMPEDLKQEILESYSHFNVNLGAGLQNQSALAIMRSAQEPIFVSVRSSATAEDLSGASFAGQQESFINVKGNKEVIDSVKKVFASIFTARSIYYRKKKGFQSLVGIAAIVQKMINSDKSGVIFTNDPVTHKKDVLIEAVFGQGEGIVSGRIKPDQYRVSRELEILSEDISDKKIAIVRDSQGITKSVHLVPEKSKQKVLKNFEIKQLTDYSIKIENHYKSPQDIEFAVEGEEIYILQTRPITTLNNSTDKQELEGKVLTKGLGASPGVSSGVVKIVRSMDDLEKIRKGDVLVTTMTNPDMVVSMQKASAIVTDEGGITAHAAIVSREMGIPCVVGTENATSILEDGLEITVDGYHGLVYQGKVANKSVEILPIVQTKTKIKVLVDLPEYAERAARAKPSGVGLVRIEGIIASSGKHPLEFSMNNDLEEYQDMIKKGIEKISSAFINKEIWIRTSDIRTDEFMNLKGAPKEIERNPMLGFHGIRFSLKNPDILKAELLAIKQVAEKGHKLGVMFPQIISAEEVAEAKSILQELNMLDLVKFGIMVETPAAVVVIDDICKLGIQFVSFGTNDLTQYTLAVDRGNELVQYLYDETTPAVLKQLSRVIRICKQNNVETSICGQAASNPKVVEFLVKQGIDSLSVNADAAHEVSKLVKSLEEQK